MSKISNIHDKAVPNGITYYPALNSYVKYRNGKKVLHLDIESDAVYDGGLRVQELMAIAYHQKKLKEKPDFEVVTHTKSGKQYFIEEEPNGAFLDADTGEQLIKYREMNEPYRAFVHLVSNFDKVNECGNPRFSRTGEFLSKSRARAIIGKANMELKK